MIGFVIGMLMAAMNAVIYTIEPDPLNSISGVFCFVIGLGCLIWDVFS